MRNSVFGKTLWDGRRGLVGWIIGITVIGCFYAAFYPTVNTPEMIDALKAYPEGLLDAIGFTDITSASGYVGSTTYGLLGPILLLVFAASLGGSAIAGEEESGRLDLTLAHPVSRWSVVIQRFVALVVAMAAVGLVLSVALIALSGPAQLADLSAANIVAASAQLALMGVFFGALALCIGAITGRRNLATAAVAIVGVGGYLANNRAPSIDGFEWLQRLSPFFYQSGGAPLRDGFQAVDAAVLAVASVVLVAIGGVLFDRRDVAV
jgi:ABC-2 type transport system permease protein